MSLPEQSSQKLQYACSNLKQAAILCFATLLLCVTVSCRGNTPRAPITHHTVTNIAITGKETLSQVIEDTNSTPGDDIIEFNLPPGKTRIELIQPLPPIGSGVTIDGANKSGGRIELDGSNIPGKAEGLKLTGTRNVIRGLAIHGFQGYGILISKKGASNAGGNEIVAVGSKKAGPQTFKQGNWETQILDNYIGTDAAGARPANYLRNNTDGIFVDLNSANVLIKRNRIAFNKQNGVNLPDGNNPPVGVRITENLIYSNGGLSIDLGDDGRTLNNAHIGDPTGPNNWQTYPVLRVVRKSDATNRRIGNGFLPIRELLSSASAMYVTVNIELNNGAPQKPYIFYMYMCEGSCNRLCPNCKDVCPRFCPDVIEGDVVECEPRMISVDPTPEHKTNDKGHLSFSYPVTLPDGFSGFIFGIAVRADNGNTSEFSDCVRVQ